jgi:thiol-disulfide isomerase/thioredoxin
MDFYRQIPADLTEATLHGASNSMIAAIFMTLLFLFELSAYLSVTTMTEVALDVTDDSTLRINFNVTMMDLPCDYAVVDVVDLMGTNRMNITKNIEKWQIDELGVRRVFQGRNKDQKDIAHDDHHGTLEELHENGEHAYHITAANYDEFLNENDYSFLNFYAPWCVWCQRLDPTWEAFAELVEEEDVPVKVVKINCVDGTYYFTYLTCSLAYVLTYLLTQSLTQSLTHSITYLDRD